ncbi:TTN [Mytilus edulis]|uniref:TTN n=1 Tax=Mytilus edulis TaxID=6550 RepID=A0A8S3QE71_MYTED|nr:TTN [Mytilus edulis]
MNGRENRDEKQSKKMYTSRKDNITEPVLWKIYAWISTFVVCIIYVGLIFAVCANGILDKYYHKAYLIRNPPASLTFVEGQTMFLTYKLLINRFVVVFKRNDDVIGEDSHNNEIEPGRSKTLTIQHITLNDEGEYYLEALGLTCRRTMVTVKQMFKKTLTKVTIVEGSGAMFECETEEENSPVEWFKDGKTINDTSENIKMESLQGYIYKLTITSTSLQDTGTYTILKNGIRNEAVLEVKGDLPAVDTGITAPTEATLFKRPLEKVTIVEGFDVQFECETEEDSSSVKWFKDDFPITPDKNNLKMETLPGHIYKLIISPASLQDSGRYRIEKNGIRSEAVLDVKGNKVDCFIF